MSTITVAEVIAQALREINVIAETQEPSAEQGKQCRRKLNAMMELWRQDYGVDLGWYETDSPTDIAEIPLYAEIAVYSNLAIYCAPQYGKAASPELVAIASRTQDSLIRIELRAQMRGMDMTHLPEGSGQYGTRYDITTDD